LENQIPHYISGNKSTNSLFHISFSLKIKRRNFIVTFISKIL